MDLLIKFLVAALLATLSNCASPPAVKTKLGPVVGVHKKSLSGRTFSSFEGIPYAQPPVGQNRFKAPQPLGPWLGTWNASRVYTCVQYFLSGANGEEDCLYLNVYVPKETPNPDDKLDVLVFVHGGAFMGGSGHQMGGPEYLMDRDVVYVSINYRLGPLGFLDTEDDAVSANNGLKDQTLALKWIHDNIDSFGGNPDSVTLAGMSAGSASAHFHYLSPLSKGLFQRGISFSGSTLNPWVLQEAPLEKARNWASIAGCDYESTYDMVECLRQRPIMQLIENTKNLFGYLILPFSPFAPTVEKNVEGAFLPDHPESLLEKGEVNDVPWIFSVARNEGIFPVVFLIEQLEELNTKWTSILPHLLDYNYTVAEDKKEEIAAAVKDKYFGGEEITLDNIDKLIQAAGERHFFHGVERAARLQAKTSKHPVYTFMLSYEDDISFLKQYTRNNKTLGVSHGTDLFYLFPVASPQRLSKDLRNFYMDLVETFSKTNAPHLSHWLPVEDTNEFRYLEIRTPQEMVMVSVNELSDTAFWDNFHTSEYKINKGRAKDEL